MKTLKKEFFPYKELGQFFDMEFVGILENDLKKIIIKINSEKYIADISTGLIKHFSQYNGENFINYDINISPFKEVYDYIYSSSLFVLDDNSKAISSAHAYTYDGHWCSVDAADFNLNRTILERYKTFHYMKM